MSCAAPAGQLTCGVTMTVALLALFVATGSLVLLLTCAVLITVPCVCDGMGYVASMVTVAPGAIGAMVQGKPAHGEVVESKTRPDGVESVMTTFVALLGPRFVTAMWNV